MRIASAVRPLTRRSAMLTRILSALPLALAAAAALGQRPSYVTVVGDAPAAAVEGRPRPWPERISWHHIDIPIVTNASRPGLLVADAAQAERAAGARTTDVVVVQLGRGDGLAGTDPDAFGRALEAYLQDAAENRPKILVTPCPMAAEDDPLLPYAKHVRRVAKATGMPLVDAHATFLRRDRIVGHSLEDWCVEGLPTEAGQKVLLELIAAALTAGDRFVVGREPEYPTPVHYRPRPDYSIPIVDVSQERERQVVVDREAGQYLGHPTTVLLEDGATMFAVYPKGHGRGPIVLKRSDDGGLTWSERLPTPTSWATSKETPTIHRVVDAEGVRRLILFSGLYPIRMAVSEDDGASWSELEAIGDYGGIVAMGSVIETKTPGRYLAQFHDDGRFFQAGGRPDGEPPRFRVYQVESSDGGLTWGAPRVIVDFGYHLCEPGAIRSPDGGTLAVLLRENSRRRNSYVIFSEDDGATWSQPREVPGALTGDRHVGRYVGDGRLFVTFRDTARVSPTHGDWVAWVGTWDDLVAGREGQYRVRLMDNAGPGADCAYPGLETLPDGTLLATTYGHWTAGEEPYIVSVRLRMAELDALAAEKPP